MFQGMEYVYAVYKEKSFSKAAEKLYISQPSLSANVKREELSIGYPIFDRSTKPIGLTEPGKHYIETAEKIMTLQNEFAEFINDWGNLRNGKLVLGGSSLYSSWILPLLIHDFSKKYPLIDISLIESTTPKLEKMLLNWDIDLLLDNLEMDENIYERCLYQTEHLVLAVPRSFKINALLEEYQISEESIRDLSFLEDSVPFVDLSNFSQESFILLKSGNATRKQAVELCHEHGFNPNILYETEQVLTAYNVTCSGMGISFISDTLIYSIPTFPNIVFYKLDPKKCERTLNFYWKKGRYFNKIMEEFLKDAGCLL